MVPAMTRVLRSTLLSLVLASTGAFVATVQAAGCSSSSSPPACSALANCCMNANVDDQSSCLETAMSGELSNAQCSQELVTYEQNGTCPIDGGVVDSGVDAGVDAKK